MGSPRKRRLKRAIAKLGFSAPLTDENKEKLASSVYMTNLLRYVQNGGGASSQARLFADGATPDEQRVDNLISQSGLMSKLEDMKLVAPLRIDLSRPDNNNPIGNGKKITIGTMVFLFTTTGGDGASGVLKGDEIVVQINGVAANSIGDQFAAAINSPAAATLAKYPQLASITAVVSAAATNAGNDIVMLESSLGVDLPVSHDAVAADVMIGDDFLRAPQHATDVPHYFMKLDTADGAGEANYRDIAKDEGVLWLQNGPCAKYIHGVDDQADAVSVLIKPPSMADAEANQKRKIVFRVVSKVASNDLIRVRSVSKAQSVASAADMNGAPAIYDGLGSIAAAGARQALEDQGDIALATFCLPADADAEGDGDDGVGGLLITFDRGTSKADDEANAAGGGLCLHWRTIGKDHA